MVFWPGLPVGEAVRRRAGVGSERCFFSGRRGGPESEVSAVPPRPDLPVGDLDRPSGLSFRYFGPAQESRVVRNVICWAEPFLGSRSMRDPRFMDPTIRVLSIFSLNPN